MELRSLKATQNFSKKISKKIKTGDIIFIFGEIGVGKTTFVRYLINHLETKNKMKKLKFASDTTEKLEGDKDFIYSFLSSVRQKMFANANKGKKK